MYLCTKRKIYNSRERTILRKIKKNTFFLFFKKTLLYSHIFHYFRIKNIYFINNISMIYIYRKSIQQIPVPFLPESAKSPALSNTLSMFCALPPARVLYSA